MILTSAATIVLTALQILASSNASMLSLTGKSHSPCVFVENEEIAAMGSGGGAVGPKSDRVLEVEGEYSHAILANDRWYFVFRNSKSYFQVACEFPASMDNPVNRSDAGSVFKIVGRSVPPSLENTSEGISPDISVKSPDDFVQVSLPPWPHNRGMMFVMVSSSLACMGLTMLGYFIFRLRSTTAKIAKNKKDLMELNRLLEERIRTRTQELQVVNANLEFQIAERKKAEERIAIQQAELLHVSRLSTLGLMSTAISHEINQPLGAISNFSSASLQLILTKGAEALSDIKSYIEEISTQSLRAGQIIKRMRSFGRKTDARRSTCDLNELVRDSLELIAVELSHRSIRIRTEYNPKAVLVIADRIQLQQLIVNLVANAADSMEKNSQELRVVTVRTSEIDDTVVLVVDDQGPGIPNNLVDRIFEPFVSTKPEGMGIGLSICEAIATDHGGHISFQNMPLGARFTLKLPKNFLMRSDAQTDISSLIMHSQSAA